MLENYNGMGHFMKRYYDQGIMHLGEKRKQVIIMINFI